ncbi:MAG: Gmad2 immunoglobulin-like domain-containing protein [Candidatus Peregrinibacteria bacterium]|nr:Gmad2 immunoglobulin-like domain-containing protein [Candidatus Peregrinibacteria bacterium]
MHNTRSTIGLLSIVLLSACTPGKDQAATFTFEECAAQGNPVMESYPRQCRFPDGRTVTEVLENQGTSSSTTQESNIRVTEPASEDVVSSPLTIRGEARVFENVFQYRLKDEDGTVLVEGFESALSPDIGQFGAFTVEVPFGPPSGASGTLEVFAYSAKDGSEIDMVRISVRFESQ